MCSCMNNKLKDAMDEGAVKSTKDIRLSNEEKKVTKKGVSFDEYDETGESFAMMISAKIDQVKMKLREEIASYIYSPMNRKWTTVVRVTAIALKFIRILMERTQCSKSRTRPRTQLRMFTVSNDRVTTISEANEKRRRMVTLTEEDL